MIECNVQEISKTFGSNQLFEKISFTIKRGERVGLVGLNGCGKTTLLKILMGLEEYETGSVHIRKDAKVGYLEQLPQVPEGMKAHQVLMQAFQEVLAVKRRLETLEGQMTYLAGQELERAMAQYGKAAESYELLDGYGLETKLNRICQGLSISGEMRRMPFDQLSGGEKTRIILGKLLLEAPDLLLLDEPSNHLDMASLEWLEDFLKEYQGTLLLISHDRYFLDQVVNRILELEPDQLSSYQGNYSAYVVEKERRYLEALKAYKNQQRQLDKLKEQIHRYRVWGAMRDSEVMYKRAKELEKRLEKIQVLDRPILEGKRISLEGTGGSRTGKQVLVAEGLEKSYGGKKLLAEGAFTVFYQDRICLLGPNGSGKSTLLKMILGEVKPDQGQIKLGAQVKIGYLPQQVHFEEEEKSLVEYFAYAHEISREKARGALAKLLFVKETVNKQIKNLSGGEKTRLKLCSLLYEQVNFLILDEPTNHLDIASREELEEALLAFEGTLFFVSHDRYFVEKLADKIFYMEEGQLILHPFGYASYREARERMKAAPAKAAAVPAPALEKREKRPRAPKPQVTEKASLDEIEAKIKGLEEKLSKLKSEMEQHGSDYLTLAQLAEEEEALKKSLETYYEKWEEIILREENKA